MLSNTNEKFKLSSTGYEPTIQVWLPVTSWYAVIKGAQHNSVDNI